MATLACGPLLVAGALVSGRFTVVVLLDLVGCCALAAGLMACHHLSQRPPASAAPGGPAALARRSACLFAFAAVGLAIVVSYNVQVAGPTARAGTIDDLESAPAEIRSEQSQGTTNITVHCENEKVQVERPRRRR